MATTELKEVRNILSSLENSTNLICIFDNLEIEIFKSNSGMYKIETFDDSFPEGIIIVHNNNICVIFSDYNLYEVSTVSYPFSKIASIPTKAIKGIFEKEIPFLPEWLFKNDLIDISFFDKNTYQEYCEEHNFSSQIRIENRFTTADGNSFTMKIDERDYGVAK